MSVHKHSKDEHQLLAQLNDHFESILTRVNPLLFTKKFGFQPFSMSDILEYCLDPQKFHFSFKKKKGEGILYGIDQVVLRRALLNEMPKEIRCEIVRRKFDDYALTPKIKKYLNDCAFHYLDFEDIGMGHSVYKVTVKNEVTHEIRLIVVKKEELFSQEFHTQLLRSLGWPTFRSKHYIDINGAFEISDFLGDVGLYEWIETQDQYPLELAKHAALGDIIGRGDRHYENYVMVGDHVVPVDISFIFWDDNDDWTRQYVHGGLYEISLLARPNFRGDLGGQLKNFFDIYYDTLVELTQKKDKILNEIDGFLFEGKERKKDYVEMRLRDIDTYFEKQKKMYIEAFFKMLNRKIYKDLLQRLVTQYPEILDRNPWLKMYYLADKDRFSTFYLLDNNRQHILESVKSLALSQREITQSDIDKEQAELEQLHARVLEELV